MNFTERSPLEQGFAARFAQEIVPELDTLEAQRKTRLGATLRYSALSVGGGAAVAYAASLFFTGELFVFLIIGFVVALIGVIFAWDSGTRGFSSAVESAVMPVICDHVGDLEYSYTNIDFPTFTFRELNLVPGYSTAVTHSHMRGTHLETGYELIHAKLEKKTRDHKNRSRTTVVFRGLLFRIDVPIDVPGRIVLMRDRGGFGNTLAEKFSFGGSRSLPKVTFDDPEFEAAFEVYGSEPEAVPGFLPKAFRRALMQIGADQGGADAFTAAFEERSFYMALKRGGAFMKMGGLMKPVSDIESDLHAIFDDIGIAHAIIARLHGG